MTAWFRFAFALILLSLGATVAVMLLVPGLLWIGSLRVVIRGMRMLAEHDTSSQRDAVDELIAEVEEWSQGEGA